MQIHLAALSMGEYFVLYYLTLTGLGAGLLLCTFASSRLPWGAGR